MYKDDIVMRKNKSRNKGRNNERNEVTLKEKIADAIDISKDVMLGVPLVSMIGDRELTIENYVGILEYTDEVIRIKCKAVNVKLVGKNLELKTMTESFLYITGRLKCFSYEY